MKLQKNILIVFVSFLTAISLAGCAQVEEVEEIMVDPFSVILQNHEFNLVETGTTEVKITKEDPSKLNVLIDESGYLDDSLKG